MSTRYLTVDEVVWLHREILLEFGQSALLIAHDKFQSAVYRPQTEAFGEELFLSLPEKAAALLQAVTIAHAFIDGNKRIALAATIAFLRRTESPRMPIRTRSTTSSSPSLRASCAR